MKIKKIHKETISEKVFNFHCTPDENYYANGILVHNCYKGNGVGQPLHNMTLDEFKIIIDKVPMILTQAALGICDVDTNPDFFPMMEYCRSKGIIPNYTCNGFRVTPEVVKETKRLGGAVAVSLRLENKDLTYDTVHAFCEEGMTQVNIHFVLAEETLEDAFKVVNDITSDKRLEKLNAIVFLQYKPKGRNPEAFHSISDVGKYKKLFEYCADKLINYGMDSCSGPVFFKSIVDNPNKEKLAQVSEPCESGIFSSYINCHGQFFPCSFSEGEEDWKEGLDVLNCEDFLKDIWFHPRVVVWREDLTFSSQNCNCEFSKLCRSCPVFNITPCKEKTNENTNRFCK